MAARTGAQKLSLLKRGWHEVPDLVCSLAVGGLGLVLGGIAIFKMRLEGDAAHMYRHTYTIIRDSDVKDPKKLNNIYN